jgi:hypothetical protein
MLIIMIFYYPTFLQTPMFADAPFFSHWLRFVIPSTTTKAVAEATFDAVLHRKASVTIPGHLAILGLLYHIIPRSIATVINDLVGSNDLVVMRPIVKKEKKIKTKVKK